jgi:hypothetical protein
MRITALLALGLALAACERASDRSAASWRQDCAPLSRVAPLSLEAAREAHQLAARRQALREREAAAPGSFSREIRAALDPERIAAGQLCVSDLADLGQVLFEHEFGFADGLGSGEAAHGTAGPFRRVQQGRFGGPETISCPSCHWVGGPNGAGAETDNAFLQGDGERTASGDQRNPPALLGLGVVEALAREMSRDVQHQRDALLREAAKAGADRETRLTSKGVDFGVLRVSSKGTPDTSGLRGIDADLVVKPFGWKGTLAHFADFASEALQVHMGMQSDRLLASASHDMLGPGSDATDPDDDGVRTELGGGPFAAMSVHLALLETPVILPLIETQQRSAAATALAPPTATSFADEFAHGRKVFREIGCAGCHVPVLVLEQPVLTLDGMPPIDLAAEMRQPAIQYDPAAGGYPVWLFSDLKRHDMGRENLAQHVQNGVALGEYLTPRLWGVADSAPYLHDGRAPSLDYAIAGHGGEGAPARAAFAALPYQDKGALRVYLMSLRRSPRVVVP